MRRKIIEWLDFSITCACAEYNVSRNDLCIELNPETAWELIACGDWNWRNFDEDAGVKTYKGVPVEIKDNLESPRILMCVADGRWFYPEMCV